MGFIEIITIILAILKAIGEINAPWWKILLPEIVALVFYALIVIASLLSARSMNKGFERMVEKERERMNRF